MRKWIPYVLALPMIFFMLIFLIGIGISFIQGFGYIPALDLHSLTLDYYKEIISNPAFVSSLSLSIWISFVSSTIAVILGVLICVAIIKLKGKSTINLNIIRLPIIIPHTIVALFMIICFSQSGLLARFCYGVGIISSPDAFPNLLFNKWGGGIILAYIWKETPFVAFFVYALMKSISVSLDEAAATLGASPLRIFFSISLPLSMPAIMRVFIIIFSFSFGAYELPFLLGVTLPKALPVQAYIEYTHPDLQHRPYAMAMNGIILMVTFVLAVVYYKLLGQKERKEK